MDLFQEKLEQYAELLICLGLNVQKGQTVVIRSPVECAQLVRLCSKKAYDHGCREVIVDWRDDCLERQRYLWADDGVFDEFSERDRIIYDIGLSENAAMLEFYVSDPDLMEDIDPARMMRARMAKMSKVSAIYQRIYDKTAIQCTASPPIKSWAKKVFPDLSGNDALEILWDRIFQTLRIDGIHDAVEIWRQQFDEMERRAQSLNALRLRRLHYQNSLGTDLTIDLHEDHMWRTCFTASNRGIAYAMNLPSEEIYTVPHRDGVNGIVYGSIPFVYQGNLIENYYLRFVDGKVVEDNAEKGADKLRALLEFDEGASHLGEVALIANDSAIRETGMLFYNPLYDENASCHLALGMGIGECLKNGVIMDSDELAANGVNLSKIHVDFMVGTDDLTITGVAADGHEIPVFIEGNFALNFS